MRIFDFFLQTLLTVATVGAVGVTVSTSPSGAVGPVNPYYASLAIEWSYMKRVFLKNPTTPVGFNYSLFAEKNLNLDTVELLKNLGRATFDKSDHPNLIIRVGGNSATQTYWSKSAPITGQDNPIGPYDLVVMETFAKKVKCKYILVVGMGPQQPTQLTDLLNAFKTYISDEHIFAIGIGNEPDHMVQHAWRTSYTPDQYFAEFDVYATAARQIYPNIPLMGPSYAYDWRESGYQIPFIQREASRVKYMSFHKYALKGCSPSVNLNDLINDSGANYQFVSDYTDATRKTNTINIWSEGGSASCGGVAGISDTFATGLWTVGILFEMSFRGAQLACMAGAPQAVYAPFTTDINGILDVRPTFYGMLMYRIALGGSNSVVYQPQTAGSAPLVDVWATFNQNDQSHTVVVINKGSSDVPVTVSGSNGVQGQLIELAAASLQVTSGFTLAGMNLGLNSSAYSEQIIVPSNGVFSFTALKSSAALIKIRADKSDKPLIDKSIDPTLQAGKGPSPKSTSGAWKMSLPVILFIMSLF